MLSQSDCEAKPTTNTNQPRVLVVGDGAVKTGFSRVIRSVMLPLAETYDIHHLAINYFGDPHDYPWPLYPARNGGDFFGIGRIAELVARLKPKLIFIVYDPWSLGEYVQQLGPYLEDTKLVFYCPVESDPFDPQYLYRMSGASRLVAYTKFAQQQMQIAADILQSHKPGLPIPSLTYIPHGVDRSIFFPHPGEGKLSKGIDSKANRLWAKRKLWPTLKNVETSFVVLNANRNQVRKRIDLTVAGFAEFARDKPDNVLLYLHMGLEDLGWNLMHLAERFGVEQRLVISALRQSLPAISDEQMNLVYNACDVGINTASCEGWGLVNFEHAATGAPQVLTAHGNSHELWHGAAELVEPTISVLDPGVLTKSHIIRADDVAAALEKLYADRSYCNLMGQAAYLNATDPAYDWNTIAKQWANLFEEVLNE